MSDVLQVLKELVAIPSTNPFRYYDAPQWAAQSKGLGPLGLGEERAMNAYIEACLKAADFEVTRQELHPETHIEKDGEHTIIPARWNVLGVKRPAKASAASQKSILFLGHTDTVDVKQGWESDPFTITPRVVEGRERWYGLGANDMKGGLAAILDAVVHTQPCSHAIKVAFVVDEEFYSFGADTLCRSEFLDDVGVAIVPEIGDGYGALNEQWLGVGRLGRNEFEFEIVGKACHGADAFVREDAINAVHEAIILESALVTHCVKARKIFRSNGIEAVNAAYLSYHNGGTPMLSVPDRARVVLDRTYLPDESPEDELRALQKIIADLKVSGALNAATQVTVHERARPTPMCRPYFFSPDMPEIQAISKIALRHAEKLNYGIGRSVADENRLAAKGIPTLILGPTGSGSHTSQEWVCPKSVVRLSNIYKEIIAELVL